LYRQTNIGNTAPISMVSGRSNGAAKKRKTGLTIRNERGEHRIILNVL
jgi:hypothetical protein